MRSTAVACIALALLLAAGSAAGGDYDEYDFGLRLSAALNRFSRYPDIGGTAGAGVASIWGSSPNPAASAWLDLPGTELFRFTLP